MGRGLAFVGEDCFFKGVKSRICDGARKPGISEKPQSLMGSSAHPLSVGAVFLLSFKETLKSVFVPVPLISKFHPVTFLTVRNLKGLGHVSRDGVVFKE